MSNKDKRSFTSALNGQKGGVRTPEGKAISSQNATKHGILSNYANALDDISYESAYEMFAEEFGDNTPSRSALISQVAVLFIRLRRCTRFENEYIQAKLNPPKYESRLVKEGTKPLLEEFNIHGTPNIYETIVIDAGKPMTVPLDFLEKLDNIYTKYETHFLNRFCTLIDMLTRSAN